MMIIQICVGSSCHLKGSQEIVELTKKAVETNNLEDEVVLSGSFCSGKCNREGVTITIDDTVFYGITRENFKDFFEKNVISVIKQGE